MGDADGGLDARDPALHQLEVRVVAQAEVVKPRSLGPGNVAGRGIALRVSVCVVPVEEPRDILLVVRGGAIYGSSETPPMRSRVSTVTRVELSSGGCTHADAAAASHRSRVAGSRLKQQVS